MKDRWISVDHRLVRDDHIGRCTPVALAVYLFLVCVADAQGLSYYSDRSVCRRLKLELPELQAARQQLQATGLVAYQKPIYQVLELGVIQWPAMPLSGVQRNADPDRETPIGEVVRRMLGGVA